MHRIFRQMIEDVLGGGRVFRFYPEAERGETPAD